MASSSVASMGSMAALENRGGLSLRSLPPCLGLGSSTFRPSFRDVTSVAPRDHVSIARYALLVKAIGTSLESSGPFDGISRKIARIVEDPKVLAPVGQVAAGIGAVIAGSNLGGHVIQALEGLPLLPQLEMVVGTIVTANFALQYIKGGEGRVRLEEFFHDLREKVMGRTETLPSEPLEVSLVEVLDENMQPKEILGVAGETTEAAVVPNRRLFMSALKTFIENRELKARQVTNVLEADVTVLATKVTKERERTEELEHSLAHQRARADKLQHLTKDLQVEKSKAFNEMTKLGSQMDGLQNEVTSLRGERFRLQKVKEELEFRVFNSVEERERLGMEIAPIFENNLKEAEKKALSLASQVEEMSREKREREGRVKFLEEQMEKTQAFSLEVSNSVGELSSEKREREAHIEWLESCLKKSQNKTTQTENKLTSLQVQLQSVLKDSESKKLAFKKEVASLKAHLQEAEVRVGAAEMKASEAIRVSQFAQAQVAAMAAELKEKAVRVEATKGKTFKLVEGGGKDMNERELEAYASLVKAGYLDIQKPSREQLNGVEALVQVLVKKGASESWARRHVLNSHAYDRRKAITWGGPSLGNVLTRVLV